MSLPVHVTDVPDSTAGGILRESAGPGVTFSFGEIDPPSGCRTLVDGVPTARRLDASPSLSTVVIPWAGLPGRTRALLRERPHLRVHNLHHNAGPTAELAIALFLAAAKGVVARDTELRRGDWSNRAVMDLALPVAGRRALVWGHGAVGSRIAQACRGLDMLVTAVARTARDGVHGHEELPELLAGADVLFLCVPMTEETRGRIGAPELARLRERAVLVNIARGPVVDEAALYEALASRRLFAAGLDVWWRYPEGDEPFRMPSGFPFHELDNVVMSPHRGGHVENTEPMRMRALGELLRAQAGGRPLANPVDVDRGY